jgi:hypothetical protein
MADSEMRIAEKLLLHNVINDYKKENNKLTEQVLERDTHIEILDKEILACREVNAFTMKKFKELTTEMNLAEMIGLGKDTGTDIAITHMAVEHKKMKKENENNGYQKCMEDLNGGISCDCMVGGECEGEGNCANGMRIKKLKEEIEKLDNKIYEIIYKIPGSADIEHLISLGVLKYKGEGRESEEDDMTVMPRYD